MFSKIRSRSVNAVQAFHNDEAGQGTVELLMIVGASALVLLVLAGFTKDNVMKTFQEKVIELLEIKSDGDAGAAAGK
jgi:hypothetical protein